MVGFLYSNIFRVDDLHNFLVLQYPGPDDSVRVAQGISSDQIALLAGRGMFPVWKPSTGIEILGVTNIRWPQLIYDIGSITTFFHRVLPARSPYHLSSFNGDVRMLYPDYGIGSSPFTKILVTMGSQ